jgi:hypothetical protein
MGATVKPWPEHRRRLVWPYKKRPIQAFYVTICSICYKKINNRAPHAVNPELFSFQSFDKVTANETPCTTN